MIDAGVREEHKIIWIHKDPGTKHRTAEKNKRGKREKGLGTVRRLRKKACRKGKGIAQTEGKVLKTEEIKDKNELC